MKFTDQDLQVLTNFNEISSHILFQKGKVQSTINTMKNMLCEYQMENEITEKFALYDLGEFLNIHDLFDKPNIKLQNNKLILKDKRFTSEYYTSDENVIVSPQKKPDETLFIKEYDYHFSLRKNDIEDFNLIRKRTKKSLPDLIIQNKLGNFNFQITHKASKISTSVSFNIDEDNKTNHQLKFYIKCDHFDKILTDDYFVEVSSKKVMKLTNRNKNLRYWIALEPDSEFDSNKIEGKINA